MNEEEVSAKIREMRSNGDWIQDSMKNFIIHRQTLEQLGFVWSLRLNIKYDYSFDKLEDIMQTTGATNMTVGYQRGFWLKLYFYY